MIDSTILKEGKGQRDRDEVFADIGVERIWG
jgi:hypothetical protein